MPEIVVTESQQSEIESIRDDLEAAFVEEYGHVRLQDAIDYLLDTYTPPEERDVPPEEYERIATAEYPQLQQIASEVADVPGSGIDADEMRGQLLSQLGTAELAARLSEVDDISESGDGSDRTDEGDSPGEKADESDDESASDTAVSDDGPSPRPGDVDDSDDGGILSAANRLLREHDEKWREADSGDEPYEVELPDGSVEGARTKDDVRQLLFRHY